MGLFVCAKCNCVENTALGWWWSRNSLRLVLPPDMKDFESGKGLCSECLPEGAKFDDGLDVGGRGKWHGKFKKQSVEDFMSSKEGQHYNRRGDSLDYIR